MPRSPKFSDELQELAWLIHDTLRTGEELTPEDLTDIKNALQRAQRIISTFEIRSRSLNNIRDEVDRYMDEFNTLIEEE